MTYVKRMLPWMTGFILIAGIQSAGAQSTTIDENRMNRDIKIMENVLQEMFKTSGTIHGGTVRARYGGLFSFGNSHNIQGTYLPGYGVIFTIPAARPGFMALNSANGNDFSFNFEYGEDEKGEKVTEESITDKIIEFLQDYGSAIGQLSDEEKVMVIYNTTASGDQFDFDALQLSGEDENEEQGKQNIPTISVAAAKSDLEACRSGDISSEQLRKRLEISKAGLNDTKQMDLKVMANILETTLRESDGGSFRITGSVDYVMLDNFGALFFGNAFSAGGLPSAISALNLSNIDSINVQPRKKKGVVSITTKSGKQKIYSSDEMLEERKKRQEQRQEQMEEHYRAFVSRLKESLVDYGRTLRSVGSDQYILISVALNSRLGHNDDLPERIDMQIQKSTLEAMERGGMDREEAIDQIQVREY